MLVKWKKTKVRKPKHGSEYQLLIPKRIPKVQFNESQKKASKKFSVKSDCSNTNRKRKNEDNNVDINEIEIINEPPKKKVKFNGNDPQ